MGASAPVKYHYPYRFFYLISEAVLDFTVQLLALRTLAVVIRADDIVRWGVWLGRHIC